MYKCPQCGRLGMKVEATRSTRLTLDGVGFPEEDDKDSDPHFDPLSPAECVECGFKGKAKDFGEKYYNVVK